MPEKPWKPAGKKRFNMKITIFTLLQDCKIED